MEKSRATNLIAEVAKTCPFEPTDSTTQDAVTTRKSETTQKNILLLTNKQLLLLIKILLCLVVIQSCKTVAKEKLHATNNLFCNSHKYIFSTIK